MQAPNQHLLAVLNDIQAGRLLHSELADLLAAVASRLVASPATPTPAPALARQASAQKGALNREAAADWLSMSPRTLDDLTKRSILKPSRATGRPLYALTELQRFLDETKS